MQGARAGIDRDAEFSARICGELLFERRNLIPQDELRALEDARNGRIDLGLQLTVLRRQVDEWHYIAHLAVSSSMTRPRSRIDRVAASRIRTTRSPACPSVSGVPPLTIHSAKCCASVRNASVTSSCGAHMSPVRYPTSISYALSDLPFTVMPLSYTFTFSLGSRSS